MKLSLATLSSLASLAFSQPVDSDGLLAKRRDDRWGDVTYYQGGLGACGQDLDTQNDDFVAISRRLWNSLGAPANPNDAWMCNNQYLVVNHWDKLVTVRVADICEGCDINLIDLSEHAFKQLENLSTGRLHNVWWYWRDY